MDDIDLIIEEYLLLKQRAEDRKTYCRQYYKEYYKKNKEKRIKSVVKYNTNNEDLLKEKRREYYIKNKEKIKNKQALYRHKKRAEKNNITMVDNTKEDTEVKIEKVKLIFL